MAGGFNIESVLDQIYKPELGIKDVAAILNSTGFYNEKPKSVNDFAKEAEDLAIKQQLEEANSIKLEEAKRKQDASTALASFRKENQNLDQSLDFAKGLMLDQGDINTALAIDKIQTKRRDDVDSIAKTTHSLSTIDPDLAAQYFNESEYARRNGIQLDSKNLGKVVGTVKGGFARISPDGVTILSEPKADPIKIAQDIAGGGKTKTTPFGEEDILSVPTTPTGLPVSPINKDRIIVVRKRAK